MLRRLSSVAAAVAFLGVAVTALAQEKGPNGGLVAGKGSHKTELVVSSTELIVYLLENGKVHKSTGTTMRAVVQQSGKTTAVALADQDGKRLVGKLSEPVAPGAVIVLTGKDDHGGALSSRYVLK